LLALEHRRLAAAGCDQDTAEFCRYLGTRQGTHDQTKLGRPRLAILADPDERREAIEQRGVAGLGGIPQHPQGIEIDRAAEIDRKFAFGRWRQRCFGAPLNRRQGRKPAWRRLSWRGQDRRATGVSRTMGAAIAGGAGKIVADAPGLAAGNR